MDDFTEQNNLNPSESTPSLVNMLKPPSFARGMSGGLVIES